MKLFITSLSAVAVLSSCSSIVSKSDYAVNIKSAKKPVKVQVIDSKNQVVHSGTTPTTVTLSAKDGYFVPASYKVKSSSGNITPLNAKLDPWYFGNLAFGGIIGGLIDPATGAMWKLDKEVIAE